MSESVKLQRTTGKGCLGVHFQNGATALSDLEQYGAAKIRFPRTAPEDAFESVIINTAGGLTGGDRFGWRINAADHSRLSVTTQACEKIYRSSEDVAKVDVEISVQNGALLHWLPQETILFDASKLERTINVRLAQSAAAVICEPYVFGRKAHGEDNPAISLKDSWRVFQGDRLVHAEELNINPEDTDWLKRNSGAGGYTAFATILLIGQQFEALALAITSLLADITEANPHFIGHASRWPIDSYEKQLIRLAATDSYELRNGLYKLIPVITGASTPPLIWRQ